jgi:hypothetical protein
MVEAQQPGRSHLFTVRLWREVLGEGQAEWRGQVRHVGSGETLYFRDWPGLQAFLQTTLLSAEVEHT